MTNTTTPAPGGEPMRATVANYGILQGKSDDMSEDLVPYAKQVLDMDPITDVNGNVKDDASYRPMQLKIDSLAPAMRSEVYRQLELRPNMPPAERAQLESKLVEEAIRGKLGSIRGMTGVRSDSLPYHKEMADIAAQVNDLQRKRANLQEAVDDVADVKRGEDPETGEVVAVPVYRYSEERRKAYEVEIANIDRNIRLLVTPEGPYGIEGAKRMRVALAESATMLKRAQELRADEAEAKRRAEVQTREDRINARAAQLAKMRPSGQ